MLSFEHPTKVGLQDMISEVDVGVEEVIEYCKKVSQIGNSLESIIQMAWQAQWHKQHISPWQK